MQHCLDVMHIKKNIFESLIDTLLDIPGKSKDGLNVREDPKALNIREELQLQFDGQKKMASCSLLQSVQGWEKEIVHKSLQSESSRWLFFKFQESCLSGRDEID